MKKINIMLLLMVSFFLTACATSLTPQNLENVKTVGVIDNFPDTPRYNVVGTTIFNNEYDKIDDKTYKALLEKTVVERLTAKGFKVSIIDKKQSNNYDMIIELVPRDLYQTPETFGYGLNQRSFLGVRMPAFTYVSLNVVPYIQGKVMCEACYAANITSLKIGDLPNSWQALNKQHQDIARDAMNDNIVKGVNEVMIKMGL